MKQSKWFDRIFNVELMLNVMGSVFVGIAVYVAIGYFMGQ